MKRFLLALGIPVLIVALLNIGALWSVAKAVLIRTVAAQQLQSPPSAEEQPDNSLLVPALGLKAPVVSSPADPTEVSDWAVLKKDLTQGIGLTEKLALPGQNGTTILLGHSSDTAPHRYATVFAGLNELRKGDLLQLKYKGQVYRYSVESKKAVSPTDRLFTELKRKDQPHQLVLVTCWPLFTTQQRLVVFAKLATKPSDPKTSAP